MQMSLKLNRPLVIVDVETTGLNPDQDRIVELAALKIFPDGSQVQYSKRLNPQIPIPPEATAVHGIHDKDVVHEPSFKSVAKELSDLLSGCDLAGFNVSKYDLRLLRREFERAGIDFGLEDKAVVDAQQIYHAKERRDLKAACRFYLDQDHEHAHAAMDDVLMTWRVINAQLNRYGDLPRDPAGIDKLFNSRRAVDPSGKFEWRGSDAAFAFGKYKGHLLQEIAGKDPEYLSWIAEKADFPKEAKQIALNALNGKFPQNARSLAAV